MFQQRKINNPTQGQDIGICQSKSCTEVVTQTVQDPVRRGLTVGDYENEVSLMRP